MSESAPPTVLVGRGPSLALPLVLAVSLHVCAGGAFWAGDWLTSQVRRPVVDLDETMAVSIVAKSDTKMAQKATRAAAVQSPKETKAPTPAPKGSAAAKTATEAPPPSSDLKIHKPNAKEQAGTPDQSAAREAMVRELLRQQLVQNADAAEGTTNRQAGDPNSTATSSVGTSGINRGDPEIAAYEAQIQELFRPLFKPLPTVVAANPGIVCIWHLDVDLQTGRILNHGVFQSSGNTSYDEAARRAVNSVPAIPPPPERFAARYANGYKIRFTPPG